MIEFFFDLMSPYAYLASGRIQRLANEYGRTLICRPFDLPAAKIAAGNYGPANREQPAKINHLLVDLERWAEHYQVPLKFPKSLDSRRANMGLFFAADQDQAALYLSRAYALSWGRGGDMSTDDFLCRLAGEMAWSAEQFLAFVNSDSAWQQLLRNQQEALQRGIFGAPTCLIDGQMWWGNDRLHFVEAHLAAAGGREREETV